MNEGVLKAIATAAQTRKQPRYALDWALPAASAILTPLATTGDE